MAVALCHVTLPLGVTELFGVSASEATGINGTITFTPRINEVVGMGGGLGIPKRIDTFVKDGQWTDRDGNPGQWFARPDSTDRTFVYSGKAEIGYRAGGENLVREFYIAVPAADSAVLTDIIAVAEGASTFVTKGDTGPAPEITNGTIATGAPGSASALTFTETSPGVYVADGSVPQGLQGIPGGSDAETATRIDSGPLTAAALVTKIGNQAARVSPTAATGTAINAAFAAGGKIVALGAGTYDLDVEVVIPPGRTLEGAGTGLTSDVAATLLMARAGVNGINMGAMAKAGGFYLRSAEAKVGTSVGIRPGSRAHIHDVTILGFGSHGILLDSTDTTNRNIVRGDNVRITGNGGDGIHWVGSDSNAGTWTNLDIVTNDGWGAYTASSRNRIGGHFSGNTLGAVYDNGNSQIYDIYVEAGVGENFRLGTGSSRGILWAPFFGAPKVIYDSAPTLLTWLIMVTGAWRRQVVIDAVDPAAGKQYGIINGQLSATEGELTNITDGIRIMSWRTDGGGGALNYVEFWGSARPRTTDVTDLGGATRRWRQAHMGARVSVPTPQTLAANGAVTIVATSGDALVTLQANATSSTITGATSGQWLTVTFVQDATGGRTYAWPANCRFAGGAAPADTTASTRSSVTFRYDGTTWYEQHRAVAVPA